MAAPDLLRLTAALVAAYVVRHALTPVELADLIDRVGATLGTLGRLDVPPAAPLMPAVPIRRSVTRDHIVCLEDGERLKTLKRHLRAQHNLTPVAYRTRWRLSPAYPMVAPSYAEQRAANARRLGLGGRKRRPATANG
jgi:predicted transcriptional regulator